MADHQDRVSSPWRPATRRQLLRALAAAVAGMAVDAVWWEPQHPVVERRTLRFADLPAGLDGLRVAQISDLHRSRVVGQGEIEHAVAMTNALAPDLIVLTGDYVTKSARYAEPCAAALAGMRAPLGRYAVLGNHDYRSGARQVAASLREAGIPVLQNQAQPIEYGGAQLWLVGMDDAWARRHDVPAALEGAPRQAFKIALMHEPDIADEMAHYPVQLQLSGHSHGGQICLPGIGPLHLPKLGRRYPMGLYRIGGLQLYVSRGVGRIMPAIRFDCPPEITLITLRRAGT